MPAYDRETSLRLLEEYTDDNYHDIADQLSAAVALMDVVGEALKLARNSMTSDARDWGLSKRDAWLWAILVGWDSPDGECTLEKVAEPHGWSEMTIARLRRVALAIERVTAGGEMDGDGKIHTVHDPNDQLRRDAAELRRLSQIYLIEDGKVILRSTIPPKVVNTDVQPECLWSCGGWCARHMPADGGCRPVSRKP